MISSHHDWHNCFWMSLWLFVGWTLTGPKKASKSTIFFTVIDWIRKKLLVDVANLATCWTNDYDILLEVLGTLGRIYVSRPVAKTLVFWIGNHDWHNCFDDANLATCWTNDYVEVLGTLGRIYISRPVAKTLVDWKSWLCLVVVVVVVVVSSSSSSSSNSSSSSSSCASHDFQSKTKVLATGRLT